MSRSLPSNPCCPPSTTPCDPAVLCPDLSGVPAADRRFLVGIAVMIPLTLALWAVLAVVVWWIFL
ncbi:MAG TPA: hypothetical protein VH482_05775 [Thermomicrobiales bacterium]